MTAMPDKDDITARLTSEGPFALAEDNSAGYPMRVYRNAPASLREVFESTRVFADRVFTVFRDETLTYGAFHGQVGALAHELVRRGVAKGDRVAIGMRNYPEWIVGFWACQAIGAVVVVLNAWWTTSELAWALEDATPKLLLLDGERLERIRPLLPAVGGPQVVVARREGAGPGGDDFAELVATPCATLPDAEVGPDDLSTILYTSGTTGRSKGAVASHRNHVTNLLNIQLSRAINQELAGLAPPPGLPPQIAVLQTLPFFHIGGITTIYVNAVSGSKAALMYKWDPAEAVRLVAEHQLAVVSGVPIVVRQLLETADARDADLSSLVSVSAGGAPVPADLVRKISARFGDKASPGCSYGLTETTAAVVKNDGADYVAHPDSIGRPVPTADIRLADEDGVDVAPGEIGEIWCRGPNVNLGYWANMEATESSFGGGWFRTGDLGRQDEHGLYYVVDRKKDVIIRGGENVYCAEVEAALIDHALVRDAAVVGLPHPEYGEQVAAVVQVALADPPAGLAAEIAASLTERLARFKIPTTIVTTTDELPRTASGKILKREVRSQYFGEGRDA